MVTPTDNQAALHLLRWVPLIPLCVALFNTFFGRNVGRTGAGVLGTVAVGASFVLALYIFWLLPATGVFSDAVYTWIESGGFSVKLGFRVDSLSAVMLLIITGVGFLIHVYSLGYMAHDESLERFFVYLNLFIFFMLVLVMADNLLVLFVGWEGVGLCSFLLIGFWYHDPGNTIAGNKAFIVNRIGDFGFLLGILLLLTELGRQGVWTLDFAELNKNVGLLSPHMITVITLLLLLGATGKSAQIPLFVWLPDAMAGPTPVSALIHAATMVTAGVYMMARLHFLYSLAPATLEVIAWIGAATAFLAATIALAQNDIKKVLAYSTVSQLGYMFLAVGLGAYSAAIFHVFTHAFFKACLFLGAGSVIHALGGEQDMRKMGGLRAHMPTTYRTYVIAALAISGAPLTAGFFSKDLILWQAFSHGAVALWGIGLLTAGLTAFYMFRQLFMVFHGELRAGEHARAHLHESPPTMTLPLVLLSLGSIFSGWLGAPEYLWGSKWERWLAPVFGAQEAHHAELTTEIFVTAATLVLVALAIYLAYWRFGRHRAPVAAEGQTRAGALNRLLVNKYYVDEIYDWAVVRPFTATATWLARVFDPAVIDGLVNGVAG
ncbi:MAG TPA: NADH-quinone oxidoreductase subunit L, partial [Candidatus Binatia bacterium]|nr:NADH-quinone oxidoreductase subunit L [Candidatus Binatia bacterium]